MSDDPAAGDLAPWHEGCSRGELRVQRCVACGHRQFPPRAVCLACRAGDLTWVAIAPRGTIQSFTIVHRAPVAALKGHTPYAIALVDLEPGCRLMTNVEGAPDDLAIGQTVDLVFAPPLAGGTPLPMARIARRE